MNNETIKVFALMSHAGRIVAIYSNTPTRKQCDDDYLKYLGKDAKDPSSEWNCWVEEWIMDGGHIAPKPATPT